MGRIRLSNEFLSVAETLAKTARARVIFTYTTCTMNRIQYYTVDHTVYTMQHYSYVLYGYTVSDTWQPEEEGGTL